MHTVKPLDEAAVAAAARETGAVFTLEEHSITGGLAGAVAEYLMESGGLRVPFKRLGLPPAFTSKVGDQAYLRAQYGLDVAGMLASIERALASTPAVRR